MKYSPIVAAKGFKKWLNEDISGFCLCMVLMIVAFVFILALSLQIMAIAGEFVLSIVNNREATYAWLYSISTESFKAAALYDAIVRIFVGGMCFVLIYYIAHSYKRMCIHGSEEMIQKTSSDS